MDKIAYCGLNCETCDAYLATKSNDQALRVKTAELWSKLNGITILPDEINCEGCRGNGVKTVYCSSICPIRQCALKRAVDTCGSCSEIESCKKVSAIISNNAEALKNLKG